MCPAIDTYTQAEQDALVIELEKLPRDDVMAKVADEDHRLRDEITACRRH